MPDAQETQSPASSWHWNAVDASPEKLNEAAFDAVTPSGPEEMDGALGATVSTVQVLDALADVLPARSTCLT